MARLLLVLALVGTVFWVYAIVDCALQPASRHRGVGKPAWLAIVVLIPVLGGALWFLVGRVRRSAAAVARRAPDDDPEFLGRIAVTSDHDERIRRLEEELAQLDAESDDARFRAQRDADSATPPKTDGDDDARGQRGAVG
ncbi:PLD nuclease N-terminal domain-containing protein [Microbacterium sp. 10M-3C3]|uniref:PLD nuclease N-terminal domain-containing protein n=1 Tax=Microbacterium sp. 10M-3C3 TaxID=2483401 RepID=UPI000F63CEA4|nr:PLD nuclease N-terminal domain-containing protein [Microbacterium sp. 10M-3C3]